MYTLQVTEGTQGKHRYYTGSAPVGELEHLVKFPDDLEELDDDQSMQRGLLKSRIKALVGYLTMWDDHFFSAVTLIILPRDLSRPAVEIDPETQEGDWFFERAERTRPGKVRHGELSLSGDVVLFPGDGQHRLAAEFTAIKTNPELSREELPVVLIPYESPEQVRQLFSDLNLNAKPVSKTIGYDFENRDPVALISKALMTRVPLFEGRVNRSSNSLPASSKNVVTLSTLVQGTRSIVAGLAASRDTTPAEVMDNQNQAEIDIAAAWQVIIDAFDPMWDDVLDDQAGAGGALREKFVFPHGLGWIALATAAGTLIATFGGEWAQPFTQAVRSLDWHRTAPVWEGNAVIHDPSNNTNRVNNTGPAIKQMANLLVAQAESVASDA